MEMLFQAQLPLMIFLQEIETSFLDILSEIVTFFGEIPLPLLISIFIYWCWDKKKGFVIVSSLMSAMMSMQILKAIFRVPRPFMKYPELIQGKRQQTATGFSFPSGHSTTAAAFYGSLAYNFKMKWLRFISIILVILVPVSRLYLGVHWPLDILIGTFIGLFSAFVLGKLFEKLYESDRAFFLFCTIFAITTLAIAFSLGITMDVARNSYNTIDDFKASGLYRAVHNLMQNSAIATGLFFGMIADRKHLNFKTAKTARNRILSLIFGLAIASAIALVLKAIPVAQYTIEFITFAFVGLWATYIFPLIATKLGLMEKEY